MNPILESIEETMRLINALLEKASPHTLEHNALTALAKQADRLYMRASHIALHNLEERITARAHR